MRGIGACPGAVRSLWFDSGSRGTFVAWVKEQFGGSVDVVQHPWAALYGAWAPQAAHVEPGQGKQTERLSGLAKKVGRGTHLRIVKHSQAALRG